MKKYLIPALGLTVKDPKTKRALPVEGKLMELDTYWTRRLQDGSVTEAKNEIKKEVKKETKKITIKQEK